MKRKLCSVLLCAFALLLLMGAAAVPEQAELMLAQEESAPALTAEELETESDNQFEVIEKSAEAEAQAPAEETEEALPQEENETAEGDVAEEAPVEEELEEEILYDERVLINGEKAPIEIQSVQRDGVTYVSLAGMAKALDPQVQVNWDGVDTVTVTTPALNMTARLGEAYVVANGRYLYVPELVGQLNGTVMLPLTVVAEAFDARVRWNASTGMVHVETGSGALEHGDTYYDQEELFWLSRVIYAESGNQCLDGRIAVGNVVMNRVGNPIFASTIQGVLAQKNQFSTYKNGKLANRTPNEGSVIAAKLVLDGAVLEETEGALWFDSARGSWASRNKEHIATIGNHRFFA